MIGSIRQIVADAANRGAKYEELAAALTAQFADNVLQSPGLRAQPEVRALALFGASVRADAAPAEATPGAAALAPSESRDLRRRIDAIDAKLDALTRKLDAL